MKKIKDPQWPEFIQNQRQLLRDEGFSEKAIQDVYGGPE
jgi:hypothetical protein